MQCVVNGAVGGGERRGAQYIIGGGLAELSSPAQELNAVGPSSFWPHLKLTQLANSASQPAVQSAASAAAAHRLSRTAIAFMPRVELESRRSSPYERTDRPTTSPPRAQL